ncbi:hypothetical protein [uncultured Pelagimonas sp.]|uniref:hypothetical protein n=1 Tax=uncultured Pelagimonas sp. TaxID=1618102 RepID=UPI00261E6C2F|nr:hypothetical protein [uncultured Pelagimonas sp.]
MHKDPKIATCCYCGTRAALVLEKARHELVCSSCGAPLHNLKRLKADAVGDARGALGYGAARPHPQKSSKKRKDSKADYQRKRKKPKKRKSFGAKLFEEAFDFLEDIID